MRRFLFQPSRWGLAAGPCSTRDDRPLLPHNRAFGNAHYGSPNTGQARFVRRDGRNGNYGSTPTENSAALSRRLRASARATAIASPARSRSSSTGGGILRPDLYRTVIFDLGLGPGRIKRCTGSSGREAEITSKRNQSKNLARLSGCHPLNEITLDSNLIALNANLWSLYHETGILA